VKGFCFVLISSTFTTQWDQTGLH